MTDYLLPLQPVRYYGATVGGEDTLRMELYTVDVVVAVAECHDLAFVALGGHFKAWGEVVVADYPGVVSTHGETWGDMVEDIVAGEVGAFRCYSVEDFGEIGEGAAEGFAYSLMAEADTEDGFLAGVGADNVEKESCLARDAGTGGEYYLIECGELWELKLIVAIDGDVSTKFLDEVREIVCERVVVVDDDNLHFAILCHFTFPPLSL